MAKRKNIAVQQQEPTIQKVKTHYQLIIKLSIFIMIVSAVVYFTDAKGYFNPDYTNDHTRRKWNAFYELTKKHQVDVVLVGNSHLYTGVNPEHLSNALGATAFILASPGTTMTDTYYSLKEAIKLRKPKVAVVETFTLNDYDSHQLLPSTLSDQFKSFSARKDWLEKLLSTPVLFASEHYAAAWSNTIRNHSFLFTDTTQIRRNIMLSKLKQQPERALYLGRYIRFTSGIEDSTLVKYDRPDFKAYEYTRHLPSQEALHFLQKTIELCRDNDVKLVLLTLPMYYRHVHDYDVFKIRVEDAVGRDVPWLDLQLPYDTVAFTPACFENTVSENQHMTYYGSQVAAYRLAGFIQKTHPDALPDRSKDMRWKQLFYASDGYFENHSPENDGVSQVLVRDSIVAGGVNLKEVALVPSQGALRLIAKLHREPGLNPVTATATVILQNGSEMSKTQIILQSSAAIQPFGHIVMMSDYLDPRVKVIGLETIKFE